ncbi:MAG: DUF2779 domain-containing protein [Balneolaceae bacterium]
MTPEETADKRRWSPREIRRHLGCPLRIHYEQQADDPPVRHPLRNPSRSLIRRLLQMRYPGGESLQNEGSNRAARTIERLKGEQEVRLYDAQVEVSLLSMRFPLIVRTGDHVTLFLTYERLWRSSAHRLVRMPGGRSSLFKALQEGALGRWALRQRLPDCSVEVRLVFPDARFQGEKAEFFERLARAEPLEDSEKDLLVEIEAEALLDRVESGLESDRLHPSMQGKSLDEQLNALERVRVGEEDPPFEVSSACQGCRWQRPVPEWKHPGCWSVRLGEKAPEGDLFSLIGRGNREALAEGSLEPGCLELPEGWRESNVMNPPVSRFSTSHRRALQILSARGTQVPREWVRKELWDSLDSVEWPLHFIDFEAAACPVPLGVGKRPYESVLFQFSCHTLEEDGTIHWNGWLESNKLEGTTARFLDALLAVPDLSRGTIVHFSPFERQALNRLFSEVSRSVPKGHAVLEKLRTLTQRSTGFLDMGHLLRDYFHHLDLNGSLGLKAALPVLLENDPDLKHLEASLFLPAELQRAFGSTLPDQPYEAVVEHGCPVGDGAVAIHAWLSLWMPRGWGIPKKAVVEALESYCWLDTWSMVLLFRYWKRLEERRPGEEDWIQF